MATPSEKLAASLEALKNLQDKGHSALQSRELSRTHRERLVQHGFIQEVMRGWYIPARPDETAGESTAWYASPCVRIVVASVDFVTQKNRGRLDWKNAPLLG